MTYKILYSGQLLIQHNTRVQLISENLGPHPQVAVVEPPVKTTNYLLSICHEAALRGVASGQDTLNRGNGIQKAKGPPTLSFDSFELYPAKDQRRNAEPCPS